MTANLIGISSISRKENYFKLLNIYYLLKIKLAKFLIVFIGLLLLNM